MKIVRPYANLVQFDQETFLCEDTPEPRLMQELDGIDLLRKIEWCARISHRSEDKVTPDSYKRFIEEVVFRRGDWSVVEHSSVTVDSLTDRGITHEWVRHRLNSFTQESTRFVNYEKKMPPSFIYPQVDVECEDCLSGQPGCSDFAYHKDSQGGLVYEHLVAGGTEHGGTQYRCAYDGNWLHAIFEAENGYKALIKKGWRPQEARSVFPNALASRILTTANLRVWRHVLIMRTTKEAHPQYRQVSIPLLRQFQQCIPILFDDIVPMQSQAEALKKAQ